jgi:hypothetical protein
MFDMWWDSLTDDTRRLFDNRRDDFISPQSEALMAWLKATGKVSGEAGEEEPSGESFGGDDARYEEWDEDSGSESSQAYEWPDWANDRDRELLEGIRSVQNNRVRDGKASREEADAALAKQIENLRQRRIREAESVRRSNADARRRREGNMAA